MRTCGSLRTASSNARVIRDLPIPASPTSSTPWPSPLLAWLQRSSSSASSWSRPTIGSKAAPLLRLEAAAGSTFAEHRERRHRHRQAFQRLRCQRRQLERSTHQLPRGLGDHHLARFGERLQPGREIGRLADHRLLLCHALADQLTDHDQPGGDADPAGQGRVAGTQPRRPPRQSPARPEPPARPRPRAPPASRNRPSTPSPMNFATWPSSRSDLAGDSVLVGAQQRAHVFGIEPLCQGCRADQIDEHHRELTALGGGGHCRDSAGGLPSLLGWLISQLADRPKQQLARPERQAELLQVGLGELRQHFDGDLVLGKDIDILAEAHRREPPVDPVSQLTSPGRLPMDFDRRRAPVTPILGKCARFNHKFISGVDAQRNA